MNKKEIFELIVKNICEVIPELNDHDFKPENRMVELGANSMDRAEVVSMTMDSLSLEVPRLELANATNIGELADLFYAKYSQK